MAAVEFRAEFLRHLDALVFAYGSQAVFYGEAHIITEDYNLTDFDLGYVMGRLDGMTVTPEPNRPAWEQTATIEALKEFVGWLTTVDEEVRLAAFSHEVLV